MIMIRVRSSSRARALSLNIKRPGVYLIRAARIRYTPGNGGRSALPTPATPPLTLTANWPPRHVAPMSATRSDSSPACAPKASLCIAWRNSVADKTSDPPPPSGMDDKMRRIAPGDLPSVVSVNSPRHSAEKSSRNSRPAANSDVCAICKDLGRLLADEAEAHAAGLVVLERRPWFGGWRVDVPC